MQLSVCVELWTVAAKETVQLSVCLYFGDVLTPLKYLNLQEVKNYIDKVIVRKCFQELEARHQTASNSFFKRGIKEEPNRGNQTLTGKLHGQVSGRAGAADESPGSHVPGAVTHIALYRVCLCGHCC